MQIIFYSSNINMIDEWESRYNFESTTSCSDLETLEKEIQDNKTSIIIADYDSVSHDVNSLISSNQLPTHLIVLERSPEVITGKMLIKNGIRAYGNARMLNIHYMQMLDTVIDEKVWTYPELTSALVATTKSVSLNKNAQELLEKRLTPKEIEVTYLVLKGLTNSAIATELDITLRTVKAHVSSVFLKLHINDRISLVLLLK